MMNHQELFHGPKIPEKFYWFNEPARSRCDNGLQIVTDLETDFWQRTHYGFRKDDGHCLFTQVNGNFSVVAHVVFTPKQRYDQCGIMLRADADHWIKLSTEYEDETVSRLGAVVTNKGFSDWATQDVCSATTERWYRMNRVEDDFLLEWAPDGKDWQQVRITHLHHAPATLEVGPYACSPLGEAFRCCFTRFEIAPAVWTHPAGQ